MIEEDLIKNINPLHIEEIDLGLPPIPPLKKMAPLEVNEISKKIKEQELGGQIRIIWTSDIGVQAAKKFKNTPLSDYKSGAGNNKLLQVSLKEKS